MATTVHGKVLTALGASTSSASVEISLFADILTGRGVGYVAGTGEIVGTVTVHCKPDGSWRVALTPNALITPLNTVYTVRLLPSGETFHVSVPNDNADHWVDTLLVPVPTNLPGPTAGPLGGDVVGIIGANTIAKIVGVPVSGPVTAVGQGYVFDGTYLRPSLLATLSNTIASSVLVNDGDILTRAGGVPAPITRAQLAADAAFTGAFDASGAAANAQAFAIARANHTGTQLAATISNFDTQVRTSRLDQMAAPTADVSLNTHKLTNVVDPTLNQDAATRGWTLAQITALINGAPGILDTLGEIATALQSDETTAAALATTVAGKVDKSTLTTDGDLYTRSGGSITRITRAGLAGDAAFTTVFQPLDAQLSALAGLAPGADQYAYFTGLTTAALGTVTAFSRTALADVDAPAWQTTLGLGTAATHPATDFDAAGLSATETAARIAADNVESARAQAAELVAMWNVPWHGADDHTGFERHGYGVAPRAAIRGTAKATFNTTTLTDTGKFTGLDLTGACVFIVAGTGKGQMRFAVSNTADTITLEAGFPWTTTPDATSRYVLMGGTPNIVAHDARTRIMVAGLGAQEITAEDENQRAIVVGIATATALTLAFPANRLLSSGPVPAIAVDCGSATWVEVAGSRIRSDFTYATTVQLVCTPVVALANAQVRVEYTTDLTGAAGWTDLGATPISLAAVATVPVVSDADGSSVPAGAQTAVLVRLAGETTSGATTPAPYVTGAELRIR